MCGFMDFVFPRNQKQPGRQGGKTSERVPVFVIRITDLCYCDTDFMDPVYGFYGPSVRILRIYTDTVLTRAYSLLFVRSEHAASSARGADFGAPERGKTLGPQTRLTSRVLTLQRPQGHATCSAWGNGALHS
jgi:hypothetical protein